LAVHEESIREFGSVIFKMGVALDTARLSIQMLCNIIMEKEIVSKEELSERYDRDVVKKLQAMQLDAKRQMEEMMAAVKAEAEKAKAGPAELLEKDITPEHLSDVVLPSERGGGIVTFPSRKPVEDENR
jgi:phosphoribosylformylglycinamidine (FGAM) synthase-like enzyme